MSMWISLPGAHRLCLTIGSVRYAGIKIHETRIIRLLEVLPAWRQQFSAAGLPGRFTEFFLESFQLSEKTYGLNQLRYDLRKLKGHGLLERDGSRYTYRLTTKGIQWPSCSCSSTNACADRLLTAASITFRTLSSAPEQTRSCLPQS